MVSIIVQQRFERDKKLAIVKHNLEKYPEKEKEKELILTLCKELSSSRRNIKELIDIVRQDNENRLR